MKANAVFSILIATVIMAVKNHQRLLPAFTGILKHQSISK